jgi:hypothetical protein
MWQTQGKLTIDKHMEISIKGKAQKEYNFNPKLTTYRKSAPKSTVCWIISRMGTSQKYFKKRMLKWTAEIFLLIVSLNKMFWVLQKVDLELLWWDKLNTHQEIEQLLKHKEKDSTNYRRSTNKSNKKMIVRITSHQHSIIKKKKFNWSDYYKPLQKTGHRLTHTSKFRSQK